MDPPNKSNRSNIGWSPPLLTIGHIRQGLHPITNSYHLLISSRRTIRRIIYVQPIITTSFLYYPNIYLSTSSGNRTSGSTSSGIWTSGNNSSGSWIPPVHRYWILEITTKWPTRDPKKCWFLARTQKCLKKRVSCFRKNRKTGKQGELLFLLNFRKNHIFTIF